MGGMCTLLLSTFAAAALLHNPDKAVCRHIFDECK